MTVSVVIPARNAARTIVPQLDAIAAQSSAQLIEVIVADNGSDDDTAAVAMSRSDRLPLRVIDASTRPGPGAARNAGAAVAKGDVLLFCDADDVVMPDWLDALASCVAPGRVAVGCFRLVDNGSIEVSTAWEPTQHELPKYLGQVPLAYSSTLGLTRADFERVGGFDEALRCGEDADLGIRLRAAGCELRLCRGARVVMRNRPTAWSQFRQFVEYGRWDAAVFRKHRGVALERPRLSEAVRDYASLIVHVNRLFDPRRRRSWVVTAGQRLGRLLGSARERVLFL